MDRFFSGKGRKNDGTSPENGYGDAEEINARIVQTGLKVREEAQRLLALETVMRKRPQAIKARRLPALLEAGLTREEKGNLIEVTDTFDRPLFCLSPESALRQKMLYRLVSVALRRRSGRLVLHKRNDARLGNAGLWDFHTGFVLVGEAREDAALRLLHWAGLDGFAAQVLAARLPDESTRANTVYFTAEVPDGLYPLPLVPPEEEARSLSGAGTEMDRIMEVDVDEFDGLTSASPELFTPEVVWMSRAGLLVC